MEKPHIKIDKTRKTKVKEVQKFSNKNNTHAIVVTSATKRKLQKEEEDTEDTFILNENLDTDFNKNGNTSRKLESVHASISKSKDTEKQSPDKKKAKTVDVFEERIEKKKQRALLYEKYLQRGGARNPGSKEIPNVRIYIYV